MQQFEKPIGESIPNGRTRSNAEAAGIASYCKQYDKCGDGGGAKTAEKTQGIAEELDDPHSIAEKLAMQRILNQINKIEGDERHLSPLALSHHLPAMPHQTSTS